MTVTYRADRGWWYVNFVVKLPDGTPKYVREKAPVNTRAGAEAYERSRRKEITENGTAPAISWNEFLPAFLTFAENNTKSSTHHETVSVLRHHLTPAFGDLRLDQISSEVIEDYKNTAASKRYEKPLSRKTINNHLIILSRVLHLAHEWGRLKVLPKIRMFPGIAAADRPFTFLAFKEADRFIEVAARGFWHAMIVTALHTGLRIGELCALRWSDVDLVAGRLTVRQRLWRDGKFDSPKSGKGREIPLSETVRKALNGQRHLRGILVFCDEKGQPFTYSACRNAIEVVSRRAAVGKSIMWHDLRHTFASHLVMRGVPLKVVQELMGHATLELTLRYAHLAPAIKSDAVRMLDTPPTSISQPSESQ